MNNEQFTMNNYSLSDNRLMIQPVFCVEAGAECEAKHRDGCSASQLGGETPGTVPYVSLGQ